MLVVCFPPFLYVISLVFLPLFEASNELEKQEKHQNYDSVGDYESQEELGLKAYVRRQEVRESI